MRDFIVRYYFQGTYEEQVSARSRREAEDKVYQKLDDLLPYDENLKITLSDEPENVEEVTLDE